MAGARNPPGSSTCSRSPNRCSRCPTATSVYAAISTRASRTAYRAHTWPGSSRCGRCPTPKPDSAIPRPGRPSSTSPTASCCDCWSMTSRSTCATANLIDHERTLDLRAGTLTRLAHWRSPGGKAGQGGLHPPGVRWPTAAWPPSSTCVEAIDEFVRVTVQSELVTNEDQPETIRRPPRRRRY